MLYLYQLLEKAVCTGDLLGLKRLLKENYQTPDMPDPRTGKPLYFRAIECFQQHILEFCIRDRKQIDKDFGGNTALMTSIISKNEQAFRLCLEKYHRSIHMVNNNGYTALLLSVIHDQRDMLLDLASSWGRHEIISLLIQHGADAKLVNKQGWTVFDYAYSKATTEYLQLTTV
ncbi:ankyrin repeat-containing domain protein [Gorgonomyces haynaldii]|nr:ankyrin repeat-containing domain protein [Gorgonomyces haynaldii]